MIICIGKEEYALEELVSQVEFDIFKLDAVIDGMVQGRQHKDTTLEWLRKNKQRDPAGGNLYFCGSIRTFC